jgi:hypothetical protein
MANEQLLSDIGTPHINGTAARVILPNEVLANIYQKEIESNGRGVTERFSTDTSGAQIRVVRVKPLTQDARELGAGLNGANFNADKDVVATVEYGLNVITVLDSPFDIATVSEDLIPVDLLKASIDNFSNLVTLNVNAMTIAGKFLKTMIDTTPSIKALASNATDFYTPLLEANSLLDDGDVDNGVTMFPMDDRIGVIRPSLRPKLMKNGVLSLGGSNYAQQMLADGTLSPGSKVVKLENGYIGDFDGVPVHIAANAIWNKSEQYLGLPKGELDAVLGYFSSGMSNARGVAQSEQIKIIDSPDGQGKRVQPLVRMGFESFYAKGNAFIVSAADVASYANPLTVINTLVANTAKLLAPASRKAPTITVAVGTDKKVTPTVTFGTGKSLLTGGNLYYVSDKATNKLTVAEFNAKYTAATVKGAFTSAAALDAQAVAGTYYYYFMSIDNDGTAAVVKSDGVVIAGS